jgi:hypothetical protein
MFLAVLFALSSSVLAIVTPRKMCRIRIRPTHTSKYSTAATPIASTISYLSSSSSSHSATKTSSANLVTSTASKQQPAMQLKNSGGGYASSSSLTFYYFNGVGSFCDGKPYPDNAMVVAISSGLMGDGHTNCGKKMELFSPDTGKQCIVTVVDKCDQNHGCRYDFLSIH